MRLSQILDLFAAVSRLNVYPGELEVRSPGAPTISPDAAERGPPITMLVNWKAP